MTFASEIITRMAAINPNEFFIFNVSYEECNSLAVKSAERQVIFEFESCHHQTCCPPSWPMSSLFSTVSNYPPFF